MESAMNNSTEMINCFSTEPSKYMKWIAGIFGKLDPFKYGEGIGNLVNFAEDFYGYKIDGFEDRWFYDGISFGELDYKVENSKFEGEEKSQHVYNANVKEKIVKHYLYHGIDVTNLGDVSYVPFIAKLTKGDATITTTNPARTSNGILTFGLTMGKNPSTVKVEPDFELGTMPEIGDEIALNPKDNIFTDSRDGHKYKYVKIGSQVWMAENLAYLPSVYPSSNGSNTEPRYYVYYYQGTDVAVAKQQTSYTTYGVLYNLPAALIACPAGWHLPNKDEWATLINYLGGINTAGAEMKATSGWYGNGNGNNSSGFSGLPGGGRFATSAFNKIASGGHFWESTVIETALGDDPRAWYHHLYDNLPGVHRDNYYRQGGFSVRCIKD
jgi:uncharacterized protein (TIGR02145 family)